MRHYSKFAKQNLNHSFQPFIISDYVKYLPIFLFALLLSTISNAIAETNNSFTIPRSEVMEITDPKSGRVYPIFVKLPQSYKRNESKTYSVIYLTDAPYAFQIVSGATRFPMNTGKMHEAIIVGIAYSKGSRGPSSRVRDFTHAQDSSWKLTTGQASEHRDFIEKTIFPFIEKKYRTKPMRTYVGNSLGGLFGAYILMTKPNMFDNYVIGSPSVWFKNNDILSLTPKTSEKQHKVFIAVGALESPEYNTTIHDMVEGANQLKSKLSKQHFPNTKVKYLAIEAANHETAFPTTATQGLYWLHRTDN